MNADLNAIGLFAVLTAAYLLAGCATATVYIGLNPDPPHTYRDDWSRTLLLVVIVLWPPVAVTWILTQIPILTAASISKMRRRSRRRRRSK